jgi:aldehyde dehydrogenase (NAD+)
MKRVSLALSGKSPTLQAGRVLINSIQHDPFAPFGGYKQSGVGREYGVLGLESFLEPKTLIGV